MKEPSLLRDKFLGFAESCGAWLKIFGGIFWQLVRGLGVPKVHMTRNAYGFLVLTLIGLILDVGVILIGFHAIDDNNHKFCQVLNAATSSQVSRPADPIRNKAQEQQWEWYQRYMALGKSLGC